MEEQQPQQTHLTRTQREGLSHLMWETLEYLRQRHPRSSVYLTAAEGGDKIVGTRPQPAR